ncbi:acetyl-CoA acetyltransferase [Pontixanthobacter aestiaquae]|uniref:Acetyl-CoA acetyltransferase n=1 Tax=Pontixanthobacter aestiaquae TaxID=1509367 RepID=A0A844Z4N8_9SPHN|nr:acetyl-CoA acetyltransferase [Pontixanthobacter aestiaquae]MDN3647244.1 acetyl-CoA acetyltransferase [Pontixanthobacter aestiaquae]MXO81780.1 acetyl-CoA acetyltransferase [Pontixanthobacter aestiaquae]
MSAKDPSRIPVIIGVGQINDRADDPREGLDPVELMAEALRRADQDAGGDWLSQVESLAVVDQIAFRHLNPVVGAVAEALKISPGHTYQTPLPMGDSPIMLLNEAANRIGAGAVKVAAVVGAEALRTAAKLAALAKGGSPSDHNKMRARKKKTAASYPAQYGLVAPVDIYPLYENATRAAWEQSLGEGQAESGVIWSLFSKVAAEHDGAWIREEKSAEEVCTPSATNRPIAFPYTKFMVANSSVNQGAGFIVTSLAMARERGVPEDQIIYVGHGAAAHEHDDILQRDRYDYSAGMEVSLTETLRLNQMTLDDIHHAELYSCFPCVPKMARRVIGWPEDREATVFGGLTFGGGPIGNYMSHAVVAMVQKLRGDHESGGANGLLFANGGYATHNHSIVVSSRPLEAASFPQMFDYQDAADAKRDPTPMLDEQYEGAGTIESYTVFYNRDGSPRDGVVVARNPAGARFLAKVAGNNHAMIAFLTDGSSEPVGTEGTGERGDDGLLYWRSA